MVVLADASDDAAGDVVLEVAIECLVLTVFDFKIGKITSTMLRG